MWSEIYNKKRKKYEQKKAIKHENKMIEKKST